MSLLTALKNLTDSRRPQAKQYKIHDVVFCVILALISNCNSYRDCAVFIKENNRYLKKKLQVKWKHPPSYSTIRNILISINEDNLQSIIQDHTLEYLSLINESIEHIIIDGKSVRGSYDNSKSQKPSHMLNVFIAKHNLIISQIDTRDDKTNEIPVAQDFIKKMNITNSLISFDVLHCQRETVKQIGYSNNDMLVQVKANQKGLLNCCKRRMHVNRNYQTSKKELCKAHGRVETRGTQVFFNNDSFLPDGFRGFKTLIRVDRHRDKLNTLTHEYDNQYESSIFLCTRVLDARNAGRLIKEHWAIENRLHNVLDNAFAEDKSRIRVNPHIMIFLRSLALNILRMNKKENINLERTKLSFNRYKVSKLKHLWN